MGRRSTRLAGGMKWPLGSRDEAEIAPNLLLGKHWSGEKALTPMVQVGAGNSGQSFVARISGQCLLDLQVNRVAL